MKDKYYKIQEIKSWIFEKTKKFYKLLDDWLRNKRWCSNKQYQEWKRDVPYILQTLKI